MKPLIALVLTGLFTACTVTSTAANPDCSKYPYLDICKDAVEAVCGDRSES